MRGYAALRGSIRQGICKKQTERQSKFLAEKDTEMDYDAMEI
jgi:hypothetical protein